METPHATHTRITPRNSSFILQIENTYRVQKILRAFIKDNPNISVHIAAIVDQNLETPSTSFAVKIKILHILVIFYSDVLKDKSGVLQNAFM